MSMGVSKTADGELKVSAKVTGRCGWHDSLPERTGEHGGYGRRDG